MRNLWAFLGCMASLYVDYRIFRSFFAPSERITEANTGILLLAMYVGLIMMMFWMAWLSWPELNYNRRVKSVAWNLYIFAGGPLILSATALLENRVPWWLLFVIPFCSLIGGLFWLIFYLDKRFPDVMEPSVEDNFGDGI